MRLMTVVDLGFSSGLEGFDFLLGLRLDRLDREDNFPDGLHGLAGMFQCKCIIQHGRDHYFHVGLQGLGDMLQCKSILGGTRIDTGRAQPQFLSTSLLQLLPGRARNFPKVLGAPPRLNLN